MECYTGKTMVLCLLVDEFLTFMLLSYTFIATYESRM